MGHPYSRSAKFLRQRKKAEMIDDGRHIRGMPVDMESLDADLALDEVSRVDITRDVKDEHREA